MPEHILLKNSIILDEKFKSFINKETLYREASIFWREKKKKPEQARCM